MQSEQGERKSTTLALRIQYLFGFTELLITRLVLCTQYYIYTGFFHRYANKSYLNKGGEKAKGSKTEEDKVKEGGQVEKERWWKRGKKEMDRKKEDATVKKKEIERKSEV